MLKSIMPKALILLHVVAGIYAGACLGIAVVDLRFLISISDSEYILDVLGPMLSNMGQLMVPQLVILFLLCVVFSLKAILLKKPLITHIPLVLYLAVLGITLAVHIPINLAVFAGEIPVDQIDQTIHRWDLWHWIRTALALLLPAAIVKFYRPLVHAWSANQ